MSSISLGENQRNPTWDGLPGEIRLLILKALRQDGCSLGRLATVSREWQTELERHNFARIKRTPSRLDDFASMTHRNRALVGSIWFCLELDDYDCTACAPKNRSLVDLEVAFAVSDTDHCPITASFENLFSILSTWGANSDVMLDISIYSPSDSKHWFKYLTFMPDTPSDMLGSGGGLGAIEQKISNQIHNEPQHGWVAGFRHSAPPSAAICKVFDAIMEEGLF